MTSAATGWLDRTHVGDCRHLLRQMALDGVVVNMCVTSPPYFGLRSYLPDGHPDKHLEIGRSGPLSDYVHELVEVFRHVRSLLSADGTLWLNLGDCYNARSGQRKAADRAGPKQRTSRGSIGAPSRHVPGLKPKDLIGIPWLLAFALRDDGWYLRQDIIWAKPNPMPESVRDRCTRSHEYVFLLSKSRRYRFDPDAISEPSVDPRGPGNVRPVRQPPGERISGPNGNLRGRLHQIGVRTTRRKRDVWTMTTRPSRGDHFAVFPDELAATCILAGTRIGGVVLDPFMGAGTTALVAKRLGRRFVGCELNPDFLDLHHQRR